LTKRVEDAHAIDWNLLPLSVICIFQMNHPTCPHCHGRNWQVWFSEDVQIQSPSLSFHLPLYVIWYCCIIKECHMILHALLLSLCMIRQQTLIRLKPHCFRHYSGLV
jgi:hypothetical protein